MEIPIDASIFPDLNRSFAEVPNEAVLPVLNESLKALITSNPYEDASETKVLNVTPLISPTVKGVGLVSNAVAERGDVDSYGLQSERHLLWK